MVVLVAPSCDSSTVREDLPLGQILSTPAVGDDMGSLQHSGRIHLTAPFHYTLLLLQSLPWVTCPTVVPMYFPPSIPAYVSPEGNFSGVLSQVVPTSGSSFPLPPFNLSYVAIIQPAPVIGSHILLDDTPGGLHNSVFDLVTRKHEKDRYVEPDVVQAIPLEAPSPIVDSKEDKPVRMLSSKRNRNKPKKKCEVSVRWIDSSWGRIDIQSCTYDGCPYKTYRKQNFKCHLRYHRDLESGTGSSKYCFCTEPDCGYIASDASNLQVHCRTHKRNQTFQVRVSRLQLLR